MCCLLICSALGIQNKLLKDYSKLENFRCVLKRQSQFLVNSTANPIR